MTPEQLRQIMPTTPATRITLWIVPLTEAMDEFGIDTVREQAIFIAQVAHESGGLRYVSEIASGKAYDGRADLGNTKPDAIRIAAEHGSTPGPWWKGHGLIQITGYDNHLECGHDLGLDLLHQPTLLEQPTNAARSAGWFWLMHSLDVPAAAGDFDAVCDLINRGRKTAAIGDANGYASRLAYYERAQAVLT